MFSLHHQRLCTLALIVVMTAGVGCSTTPDTADQREPIEESGAEDLVQTRDVLMATSVVPDELSSLTPLFQRVAQSVDEPAARELADVSPDPIGHLESMHDLPNNLPALAESRPSYVLLTDRGNTDFLQAAGFGLPTRTQEWPAYFNVRVLLTTSDTEALQSQLQPWLKHFRDRGAFQAVEVYEGSGFVRLELAVENRGVSAPDDPVAADQWLADLNLENLKPPATADFRPTPAYETFTEGDASFGLWSPADAFSRLGVFELLEIFSREYTRIGPSGQPRYFLEGVSRISVASVADDPVSSEHEDVSVLLSSDDDGTLIVDTYATRTEHGVRLREALEGSVDLPGFSLDDQFLDLSLQADLAALEERANKPHWTTFDSWQNTDEIGAGFGSNANPDDQSSSTIPFAEDESGFVMLGMATQYPWTTFSAVSDTIGKLVPLPRALALEAFVPQQRNAGLPLGAAAAAAFENSGETRMAIEQLLGFAEGALPGKFDAEMVEREDGLLEVQLVVGTDLEGAIEDLENRRDVEDTSLSLNLGPVQQLAGMMPGTDAVELFDHVHLRSHGETAYQTNRLTIGSDQARTPEPVEARVEPLANPAERCRTEMAALSIRHLSDLRGDTAGKVDTWARALRDKADQCLEADDPRRELIDERIERARTLADEVP